LFFFYFFLWIASLLPSYWLSANETLLVLNHGDVTWDSLKENSSGKQRKMIRDTIFGKSKKSYMYL
jgi:hypothetical protein